LQYSHVRAIKVIVTRHDLAFVFDGKRLVFIKKTPDNFGVFLWFQAACAINQGAAGAQTVGGLLEQGGLGVAEAVEFGGLKAPAKVHPAAEDAGVGAGSINEDAVKGGRERGKGILDTRQGSLNHGDSEAAAVFADKLHAVGVDVLGHDAAGIVHALGEESGFASGGGAKVEDGFAGLGLELDGGEERGGVLQIEPAFAKTGQGGEGGMGFELEAESGGSPVGGHGPGLDLLGLPMGEELFGGPFEGVQAGEGDGGNIIPLEEGPGGLGAELAVPLGDEPIGMGIAEGGVGSFEVGEDFADFGRFAEVGAEDGVDKTRLGGKTGMFGQFDGFVHGGMGRDAVEPKNLIEAEPEQILEGEAGPGAAGFAGDETVEGGFPPDHAANELVTEAPIGRGKPGGGEGDFEEILGKFAGTEALGKHPRCNLSWILAVQQL